MNKGIVVSSVVLVGIVTVKNISETVKKKKEKKKVKEDIMRAWSNERLDRSNGEYELVNEDEFLKNLWAK